jgi:hypothetical protein
MNTQNRRIRLLVLLPGLAAAFLALCGCPESMPLRDLREMKPEQTVALFCREEAAVATLQAEAKASIESPKRSGTLQAVILVKRPHSFRMRAYPRLIGGTVFDLAVRKDRIEFFLPSEETLYVQKLGGARRPGEGDGAAGASPRATPGSGPGGPADPATGGQGDRAKPDAEPERAPDLDSLFGSTSLARMILGTTVEEGGEIRFLDQDLDGIRLAVIGADGVVEGYVWLSPVEHLKTKQVVFGEGGKTVLALAFDDWEKHEATGLFWPGTIAISAPQEEFGLEMSFDVDELALNEPIEEADFDVEVPEGTRRVERRE